MALELRGAVPADYDWIIDVVDAWWGRPMTQKLPRLFLDHFYTTSLIAEDEGQAVGFLVGFFSPSVPAEAYIHFVGVDPGHRERWVGRSLYEEFFASARRAGRTEMRAITSSTNESSVAFHLRMGFSVAPPVAGYNGPDTVLVAFHRPL
jgi:ribosomal protein S18 acetylase RimI-like enzyme